jgi:hypothetical protein
MSGLITGISFTQPSITPTFGGWLKSFWRILYDTLAVSTGLKNLTGGRRLRNLVMTTIHVNRVFLEAIEIALNGPMRRLAKDIAAALGKPEDPLLKSIQMNKITLQIFEEGNNPDVDSIRCKYYMPYNDHFLVCCNEPVVWLSTPHTARNRCIHHIACKQPPISLPKITIISIDQTKYFVDMEAAAVYNEEGVRIGVYLNDTIRLFYIQSE